MAQAPKSFQQVLQELWELLKAYAQQETIGPLKNLGRQIGFGVLGTVLFSLGYFLIVLGVMRLLQTQTTFFRDHNYLTYLVAVVLLLGACTFAGMKAKGSGSDASRSAGKPAPAPSPAALGEDN